jgi:hypothetical protein
MLKLKTHSGFQDLFLNLISVTEEKIDQVRDGYKPVSDLQSKNNTKYPKLRQHNLS